MGHATTARGGILLARWLANSLCCTRAEARARPPLLLPASFLLHARENDIDSVIDGADSDTNFAHSDDSKIDVDSLLLLVLLESCAATGSLFSNFRIIGMSEVCIGINAVSHGISVAFPRMQKKRCR